MSTSLKGLLESLSADPWRKEADFSDDMRDAHEKLLNDQSDETRREILSKWIQSSQPCLFGRIASKLDLLTFCFLSEQDLLHSDKRVEDKIQEARLEWTQKGYLGKSSGFIISVISPRLSLAKPNEPLKKVAVRLASLYLQTDVVADSIFHDEVFLEVPTNQKVTWKFLAGVNYFGAQGDKRWWSDHRFPCGMAFSINSVGHMVKSVKLLQGLQALNKGLELPTNDDIAKVESLPKALLLAMQTIANATDSVSGKSTNLISLKPENKGISCPIALPKSLKDRDHCEYEGFYHTDFTVPSEYFSEDIARSPGLTPHALDFTYLFREGVENPAHVTMGEGKRIRLDEADLSPLPDKLKRVEPEEVSILSCPRLKFAISK